MLFEFRNDIKQLLRIWHRFQSVSLDSPNELRLPFPGWTLVGSSHPGSADGYPDCGHNDCYCVYQTEYLQSAYNNSAP